MRRKRTVYILTHLLILLVSPISSGVPDQLNTHAVDPHRRATDVQPKMDRHAKGVNGRPCERVCVCVYVYRVRDPVREKELYIECDVILLRPLSLLESVKDRRKYLLYRRTTAPYHRVPFLLFLLYTYKVSSTAFFFFSLSPLQQERALPH